VGSGVGWIRRSDKGRTTAIDGYVSCCINSFCDQLCAPFSGSPCFPDVAADDGIRLTRFPAAKSLRKRAGLLGFVLFLFQAALKLTLQCITLLRLLFFPAGGRPDLILVQNPPSIPTLLVARLAAWKHRCALIIDWHNYGWSILAMGMRKDSTIVQLAEWYEWTMGSMADGHLCVTSAMREDLRLHGVSDNVAVLHDRANPGFKRLNVQEAHNFLSYLFNEKASEEELPSKFRFQPAAALSKWMTEWMDPDVERMDSVDSRFDAQLLSTHKASLRALDKTLFTFTSAKGGLAQWRPDRPTLIVSSTSWTADEDFTILERAILEHDNKIAVSRGHAASPATQEDGFELIERQDGIPSKRGGSRKKKRGASPARSAAASTSSSLLSHGPLPRALYVITGKGDMREAFLERVSKLPLRYSAVLTIFATPEDYRSILGVADLGVSLHTSSSGLDLPMKVVDMFGAGLPVCAVRFKWSEAECAERMGVCISACTCGWGPYGSVLCDVQHRGACDRT
jgi:beta-1,4-mannosyltransferase